jgi:hypothetical protein
VPSFPFYFPLLFPTSPRALSLAACRVPLISMRPFGIAFASYSCDMLSAMAVPSPSRVPTPNGTQVPPQWNLEAPLPPVRGFFFRRQRAIYGEAMNTLAKVALVAVIVLFTVLLLWGLLMQ